MSNTILIRVARPINCEFVVTATVGELVVARRVFVYDESECITYRMARADASKFVQELVRVMDAAPTIVIMNEV